MKIDSGQFTQEALNFYGKTSYQRTSAGYQRSGINNSMRGFGDSDTVDGKNRNPFSSYLEEHNQDVRSQILQRTQNISSNRKISSSLSKIRQSCLDYLFYLLFAQKGSGYGGILDINSGFSEGTDSSWGFSSNGDSSGGNWLYNANGGFVSTSQNVSTYSLGYSYESYTHEYEKSAYAVQGTVKTADGRDLSFNLSFDMTREFEEYYAEHYEIKAIPQMVNLMDPLVINLDTNIATLSDQKFTFDLDADGKTEEISMLGSGSGFLALDKNGDGIINDGSELFGTQSGDGFLDLAKYDQDGNGWIDENDEIFDKLKIWVKDEEGHDQLYSLKEKNVGALNLNALSTNFSHKNMENNRLEGVLRQTSFFLYEDGTAGTIQHLDLAS
ncbi:MAG: hypothetical protein IJU50_05870 [Lachnospiraceae bacterium]|nr:hypothetical protein [Lachnospiraceae bacterium]